VLSKTPGEKVLGEGGRDDSAVEVEWSDDDESPREWVKEGALDEKDLERRTVLEDA
jgi:hypothetical protein